MFELRAKNRRLKNESYTWFNWRQILEKTGAGYVLGFGFYGDDPEKYVYEDRNGSPLANDGFEVTEFESKAMAACCRGYVDVKRYIEGDGTILRIIEQFAEFAERSEGFTIN